MMGKNSKVLFVCAAGAAILWPTLAYGQVTPDASLWTDANGNPVFNPDGSQVVPAVAYDPRSGLMTVDTRGLNSVDNTATGTAIGGDDVGLILLLVEGPQPLEFLLGNPPSGPPQFRGTDGMGTSWESIYFNGKAQFVGFTLLDEFLLPIGVTEVAIYETGLRESDFAVVEVGINFFPLQPGATLFGAVQIPEPSTICLVGTAALILGLGRMERQRQCEIS